jgi:hypothetical protein
MTGDTKVTHEGKWRRLVNLAADAKGSIHDDEAAQSLGFEGAFVPGSTVGTAAMPAVFHFFGERWLEGGWYVFKFVTPVYTSNDVREVVEQIDAENIQVKVETREGRLCSAGSAGLGYRLPWDPAHDGVHGGNEVFPDLSLGTEFEAQEVTVSVESARVIAASGGDETPWYEESSPWGAPIAPPERLMNLALQVTRGRRLPIVGVRNPGMWAEHALRIRQPIFLETPYLIREHVADKGRSGRTLFVTYEFSILSQAGEELAQGRHKIKWLAAS